MSLCFEAMPNGPSFEPFDTLIVDEGQDLMLDRYWDVFNGPTVGGISHGQVRVFYDPRQNLFCGSTGTIALRLKNSSPAKYELSVNCRNTQPTSIGGALVCGQKLGVTAKADGPESVMEFFLMHEISDEDQETTLVSCPSPSIRNRSRSFQEATIRLWCGCIRRLPGSNRRYYRRWATLERTYLVLHCRRL